MILKKDRFESIGIRLVKNEFPVIVLGVFWRAQNKEILLHIQADNYDYLPIRGWWVDEDDKPLRQGEKIPHGGGFQINRTPYKEDKSWLCFSGWREYHDHPLHQDISWNSIKDKDEYRFPGIIQKLLTDLNSAGVRAV